MCSICNFIKKNYKHVCPTLQISVLDICGHNIAFFKNKIIKNWAIFLK